MRLYVIGSEGQVSRSLRDVAAAMPDIVFGFGTRPLVDLLKPDSVARALADFSPDIVVNPAAYTAVDKAEIEPELAFAINRDGARTVATAAERIGAPIIHLSTDYVFDGRKPTSYVEADPPAPLGVYGRSKLEGEHAVAASNPCHVILRTSWVYAPFGHNFVRTMLRLAGERDTLRVVNDQIGCPTYALDIAHAVIRVARNLHMEGCQDRLKGITHLAGPDAMTWYTFARNIFAASKMQSNRNITVEPITTPDFPTIATRPANSCLSTARLKSEFGISLPSFDSSLTDCLVHISNSQQGRQS